MNEVQRDSNRLLKGAGLLRSVFRLRKTISPAV